MVLVTLSEVSELMIIIALGSEVFRQQNLYIVD